MIKLTDKTGAGALTKLLDAVIKGSITATNAWSVYVKPDKNIPSDPLIILSDEEINSLIKLHAEVKKQLKKQIKNRCAYCKRVMGQHAMSWHIEHIYSKSKHPREMFKMDNLTYACLDCNYVKNNAVDRNKAAFDIIHPSSKGFVYSKHIRFLHISTDSFHFLKYVPHSKEGIQTYNKLKFNSLESLELLTSLNEPTRHLVDRIEEQLLKHSGSVPLTNFLHKLKMGLSAQHRDDSK